MVADNQHHDVTMKEESAPLSSSNNSSRAATENQELRDRLDWLRNQRRQVSNLRNRWDDVRQNQTSELDRVHRLREEALGELESILRHRHSLNKSLGISERWNTINDCFHIWHQGPFATINNCRLGAEAPHIPFSGENIITNGSKSAGTGQDNNKNSNNHNNVYTGKHAKTNSNGSSTATSQTGSNQTTAWRLWSSSTQVSTATNGVTTITSSEPPPIEAPKVPWPEVNSALGHVALLLEILSDRSGVKLPHVLHPMGATSKITANGVDHYLYFEESTLAIMPLWGRNNLRNFHSSLNALCECIFAISSSQSDKTIAIPHTMIYDKASASWKIAGIPLVYGYGTTSGVEFTRACKYLLTNLKWMVAYSVKHHVKR